MSIKKEKENVINPLECKKREKYGLKKPHKIRWLKEILICPYLHVSTWINLKSKIWTKKAR